MDDTIDSPKPHANDRVAALLPDSDPDRLVGRCSGTWRLLVPICVAIVIVLAFIPVLTAGVVNWDDVDLLERNPRYRALSWVNLRWMFTTSYAGHFQPLTWLSYAADYRLWKMNPAGYHLTNLMLHVLTAMVFYLVVRRLLAAALGLRETCTRSMLLASGFATLLFAVHPLRVESVAWLAERRDVLSGLFFMLAVLAYLRFASACGDGVEPQDDCIPRVRTANPRVRAANPPVRASGRWRWYAAAVACCGISLLAKASAMTIAPVLLVLDVYPLRRWQTAQRSPLSAAASLVVEKIPFLALGSLAAWIALSAQRQGGMLAPLASHDLIARIAQACYGLGFYVQKTLWPSGLGPIYQMPTREIIVGSLWRQGALVIVVIAIAAVWLRRRLPGLAASALAYLVMLLPVLGFFQSGPQLVADRYSYLSCLGFAVLGGAALLRCQRARWWHASANRRSAICLACVGLIVALVHATFRQCDYWQHPLSLWTHAVQVSPDSSIAQVNLGDALSETGFYREAIARYQQGLSLDRGDAIAHQHLAKVYGLTGSTGAAIEHYRQALLFDPFRRGARCELAELLIESGKPRLAVELLRAGAKGATKSSGTNRKADSTPPSMSTIDMLAQLLSTHPDASIRDGDEAVHWARVLTSRTGGRDAGSLLTLATAYAEAGRFQDAVSTASKALRLATDAGNTALINELRRRIELFRNERPYHFPIEGGG